MDSTQNMSQIRQSLSWIFRIIQSSAGLQTPIFNWKTHTWGWGAESNEVLLHVGLVNSILLQMLRRLGRTVCRGHWRVTHPQFPTICCGDINCLHTPVLPSVWLPQRSTSLFLNVFSSHIYTHSHATPSPPKLYRSDALSGVSIKSDSSMSVNSDHAIKLE